jgi:hypothetical protein
MRILSGHGERHDRVAMKGIEMYRECWADPEVRAVVPGRQSWANVGIAFNPPTQDPRRWQP